MSNQLLRVHWLKIILKRAIRAQSFRTPSTWPTLTARQTMWLQIRAIRKGLIRRVLTWRIECKCQKQPKPDLGSEIFSKNRIFRVGVILRCAVGYCNGGIWGWHKRQYCSPTLAIDGHFLQKILKPIPSPCFLSSNENWSFLTFFVSSGDCSSGRYRNPAMVQGDRARRALQITPLCQRTKSPRKKVVPKKREKKIFLKTLEKKLPYSLYRNPQFFSVRKTYLVESFKTKKSLTLQLTGKCLNRKR